MIMETLLYLYIGIGIVGVIGIAVALILKRYLER